MRADRLLSILLLLQGAGRLTARELAGRLEVSERTIYRDLDALSAAGVPVWAERGPGGGCVLAEDYRTDLTGLTGAEARALLIAAPDGPLADLELGRARADATLKLLAALPAAGRRDAERARERIHLDPARWHQPREEVPHLRAIEGAVWEDRRLRLTYGRGSGAGIERLVEPLGLVAKASVWYLVARPVGAGEGEDGLRVYRVSRIQALEPTGERFARPAGFDLAAYWSAWCADFERNLNRYIATVRVSAAFVPDLPQLVGDAAGALVAAACGPGADGSVMLPLAFESFESACARVASCGPAVEVLEPRELRDGVAAMAAGIVALYAAGTGDSAPPSPAVPTGPL